MFAAVCRGKIIVIVIFSNDAILQSSLNKHFKKILYSHSFEFFHLSYKRNEILILRRIMELPADDIVRVNKFDNLQKLYLQTIISVFHISIMKYCFYKLK